MSPAGVPTTTVLGSVGRPAGQGDHPHRPGTPNRAPGDRERPGERGRS